MSSHDRQTTADRRYGTTLFADITGFTALSEAHEPDEVYAIITGCLEQLADVARQHGGAVERYLGDCVMAVFGAPMAIENTPRAAINAAIAMRECVGRYNHESQTPVDLEVHTGVNSGLMISADPTDQPGAEFSVMGDTVNVASRLKDLAPPGTIYVGAETYRATKDDFEFRPLQPLQVKGRQQFVVPYEVLSTTERVHRPGIERTGQLFEEFVGRKRERAVLRDAADRLRAGTGGGVTITGDAGLGKTRLLTEFLKAKGGEDVTVLIGRSLPIGRNLGFYPLKDILRRWAGLDDAADDEERAVRLEEAVRKTMGDASDDTVPFVSALMGLEPAEPHRQRLEGIEGEALERFILKGLRELWIALARQRPLLVVLEDLHWADVSSVEALEVLLRLVTDHPILIVAASRPGFPETSDRLVAAAARLPTDRSARLELEPLKPEETWDLLSGLFRGNPLPREVADQIKDKTGGNPFFLEEVIRSLIEEGAIVQEASGLRATEQVAAVEIPGSVREVITTRIDRLSPGERALLQTAAVIGRSFEARVLEALTPDPEGLAEDLRRLEGLGLLEERRQWTFKHALIRDVAYDSVLRPRRQELHLRVAEVLEVKGAGTPGLNGLLAYHFSLAGDADRAEHYLFEAGDEAARSAASNEALFFFQQASERYLKGHEGDPETEKLARLHKNVALAFYNRGQFLEATAAFNEALATLGESVPRGRAAIAWRGFLTVTRFLTSLYWPFPQPERPPATDRDRETLDLMLRRAQAQTTAAPTRFLIDSLEAVRKLRSFAPASVERAGSKYSAVVGIFSYGGLSFRISERILAGAAPLVDESDPRDAFLFRLWKFLHEIFRGTWDRAEPIEEERLQQNLRVGDLWGVTTYLGLQGERLVHQGRFTEARALIERLARLEEAYDYDLAQSNRQSITGYLHLERRELEPAEAAIDEYYADHSEALWNLIALSTLAKIAVLRGDLDESRQRMAGADELVASVGIVPPFHLGHYYQARLRLDAAELERAAESGGSGVGRIRHQAGRNARRARRVARRIAWRRPELMRLCGRIAWLRGRHRRALRLWEDSAREAERLGMHPELGRTYAEVARHQSAEPGRFRRGFRGEPASAAAQRAKKAFEAAGLESTGAD